MKNLIYIIVFLFVCQISIYAQSTSHFGGRLHTGLAKLTDQVEKEQFSFGFEWGISGIYEQKWKRLGCFVDLGYNQKNSFNNSTGKNILNKYIGLSTMFSYSLRENSLETLIGVYGGYLLNETHQAPNYPYYYDFEKWDYGLDGGINCLVGKSKRNLFWLSARVAYSLKSVYENQRFGLHIPLTSRYSEWTRYITYNIGVIISFKQNNKTQYL